MDLTTDVRVTRYRESTYIHAGDLIELLRKGSAIADPIMLEALPRIVNLIETIRDGKGVAK